MLGCALFVVAINELLDASLFNRPRWLLLVVGLLGFAGTITGLTFAARVLVIRCPWRLRPLRMVLAQIVAATVLVGMLAYFRLQ